MQSLEFGILDDNFAVFLEFIDLNLKRSLTNSSDCNLSSVMSITQCVSIGSYCLSLGDRIMSPIRSIGNVDLADTVLSAEVF